MDLRERYVEDYTPGHSVTFGARTVTAEEIIAFARALYLANSSGVRLSRSLLKMGVRRCPP